MQNNHNSNKGSIARKDFTTFLIHTTENEHNHSYETSTSSQNGQSIDNYFLAIDRIKSLSMKHVVMMILEPFNEVSTHLLVSKHKNQPWTSKIRHCNLLCSSASKIGHFEPCSSNDVIIPWRNVIIPHPPELEGSHQEVRLRATMHDATPAGRVSSLPGAPASVPGMSFAGMSRAPARPFV